MVVRKGALVGVVGRVGSGKSTLLSSLLGEVALVEGRARVSHEHGMLTGRRHPT